MTKPNGNGNQTSILVQKTYIKSKANSLRLVCVCHYSAVSEYDTTEASQENNSEYFEVRTTFLTIYPVNPLS